MTATKQDSLVSKKYFDEHVELTRAEKNKITAKDDLSDKQKKVLTDLLLTDVKENQSTGEFKKHAEVRKADYAKIRAFVIERVGDAKKVTKEDMQEAVEFFYAKKEGKKEKKESKEKMNMPQLESENHKIDKGKSKKEKLAEGWKEEERPAYINGSETKIKILKKELAPGAFVWEYQDDGKMPKHMVGEQLFNCKAVLSLGLQDRLPTWENMVAMRGETAEEKQNFLKNNFQKDGKNLFPGFWDPYNEKFHTISGWTGCLLAGGGAVWLNEVYMDHYNFNHEFGFSLRLLKN